jgi:uncharacterized protein DUF397
MDDLPTALTWRKSTRSNNQGACVEVADLTAGGRAVRDTKLGEASPVLTFTQVEWVAFTAGVRDGEFD